MGQRFGFPAIAVAVAVAVVALGACGGSEEPPATTAAAGSDTATTPATDAEATATDAAASDDAISVEINEVNASGQTGTATITPNPPGINVAIDVTNDEGVAQFAFISEGTCDDLGAPFAEIPGQAPAVPPGTTDGKWQADEANPYGDDAVTLDDLRNGAYAVVIVDVSYRGGNSVEIPPEVLIYEPPDPNGPFGRGTRSLRAATFSKQQQALLLARLPSLAALDRSVVGQPHIETTTPFGRISPWNIQEVPGSRFRPGWRRPVGPRTPARSSRNPRG